MLGKRRRNRRWIPVAACLVLVVAVGTFYFLIQQGQAMSWRDMMLDCTASVHTHTEACFDEEGGIVCGYADYFVHEHTDDCYDAEGNLVCTLRQVREHHHDETCYEKVEVAECQLDESVGHVHTDSCYERTLICGVEEAPGHTHDENCYNEYDELICGMEESEGHTHSEECWQEELVCGMEAGEGGHLHTEACMAAELVLTCQKPEVSLHTHTDACYEFYDENGELLELEEAIWREERFAKQVADGDKPDVELPQRVLVCGMLQTEKHEHGSDCFKKIEEPESQPERSGLESGGPGSELESSALESSGPESSSDVESEAESSGPESGLESSALESEIEDGGENEEPVEPVEIAEAVYEDEALRVTAMFEDGLPEGAHLVVERVEDPGQLAKKQAKLKQAMEDDDYSLQALLQVGLRDEDGEPVAFDTAVTLNAEFFGEGAGVEGAKVCAVAYRQAEADPELETVPGMVLDLEKAEVLPVALGDNGGAATEIVEDTLLGFGSKAPVRVDADDVAGNEEEPQDNLLHLDQSFSYKTESMFELVFHIKGSVELTGVVAPEQPTVEAEPSAGPPIKWGEDEESGVEDDGLSIAGMSDVVVSAIEPVSSLPESAPEELDEPSPGPEEDLGDSAPAETEGSPAEKAGGETVATGSVLPANTELAFERVLEFVVEQKQEGDPAYQPYAEYVQADEESAEGEIPPLEVLSYTLYYGGQEVALSDCEVTVEVNATPELESAMAELAAPEEESAEDEVAMLLSVLGPAETPEQEETYTVFANADAAAAAREEADSAAALREVAEERFDTANADVCLLDSKDLTRESTGVLMNLRLQAPSAAGMEDDAAAEERDTGSGGTTTDNTLALASNTALNPRFTVEYYSYLDSVKRSTTNDGNSLFVINTEATAANGNKPELPQNGTGKTVSATKAGIMYLPLDNDGNIQIDNNLMKIYESKDCNYFTKPNLDYFDAVANSAPDQGDSYTLRQIWVWEPKEGASTEAPKPDGDNLNREGWKVYGETYKDVVPDEGCAIAEDGKCEELLHFTNKADVKQDAEGNIYIHIKNNSTLRLVYEPVDTTTGSKDVPVDFFDFDIGAPNWTDVNGVKTLTTNKNGEAQGINSRENYSDPSGELLYSFGNGDNSAGTGRGSLVYSDGSQNININQAQTTSFYNCSYGLVQGLNSAGELVFAHGIVGPDGYLKEEQKVGSTKLDGTLSFRRVGDMYSLVSAQVVGNEAVNSLEKFTNTGVVWNTNLPNYSNSFWPMDGLWNSDDKTHDFEFGDEKDSKAGKKKFLGVGPSSPGTFAKSDDGTDHNSYFGMHFALTFDLVKEYVGPLEYLFFGDDDMWVFLTPVNNGVPDYASAQLICDIGGVHQSVGEYVNLWNYVGVDDEGRALDQKYQLDFFYTERGASGSTCWMQFILPSVRAQDTNLNVDSGNLRIEKEVTATRKSGDLKDSEWTDFAKNEETFLFRLKLKTGNSDGRALTDDHAYVKYSVVDNTEITFDKDLGPDDFKNMPDEQKKELLSGFLSKESLAADGVTFMLKDGQYIVIEGLPLGTYYEIEELKTVKDYLAVKDENTIVIEDKDPNHVYVTTWEKSKVDSSTSTDTETPDAGDDHYQTSGTINYASLRDEKVDIQTVKFVNATYAYELPKTGGSGVGRYVWAGAALCLGGLALIYKFSRKRGKEVVHKA